MSQQQHDAGPWSLHEVKKQNGNIEEYQILAGYPRFDKLIAAIDPSSLAGDAKQENIRVMAAGGMMVDALEKLLDKFEVFIESDWTDEDDQAAYDYARGAVAVARGLKS